MKDSAACNINFQPCSYLWHHHSTMAPILLSPPEAPDIIFKLGDGILSLNITASAILYLLIYTSVFLFQYTVVHLHFEYFCSLIRFCLGKHLMLINNLMLTIPHGARMVWRADTTSLQGHCCQSINTKKVYIQPTAYCTTTVFRRVFRVFLQCLNGGSSISNTAM